MEAPLNIPIFIVLPRGFITTYLLPPSKCIQHREEDEGGIRPGGFEPLLVFAVPFLPCSPVSGSLSVILADLLPREPPFPVDLTTLSCLVFTLDEGCVGEAFSPLPSVSPLSINQHLSRYLDSVG